MKSQRLWVPWRAGSADQLLSLSAELAERNADFADVLSGMMEALHDAAVTQATGGESGPFLADEVQLYYQIALVGLRDLPIAPDPRSGFEMTMLRMLAFTPERDAGTVPPRSSVAGSGESQGETQPGQRALAPERTALSNVSPEPHKQEAVVVKRLRRKNKRLRRKTSASGEEQAPATEEKAPAAEEQAPAVNLDAPSLATERWYEVVSQLTIGGVAKMIAEHSVPLFFDETKIALLLNAQHDTLLSDAQVKVSIEGWKTCWVARSPSISMWASRRTKHRPSDAPDCLPSGRRRPKTQWRRMRPFSPYWPILRARWKRCGCTAN